MIPNHDIFRTANILIREHGQDAPIHAARRADALLTAADRVITSRSFSSTVKPIEGA